MSKLISDFNSSPDNASITAELPKMKFSVGTSIIEEFAIGHDPSAVLRELVQNEFDAGGNKMSVWFGDNALQVQGTGKPIDDAGWSDVYP